MNALYMDCMMYISLSFKKKVKLREYTILETLKIDEIPAISIIYT